MDRFYSVEETAELLQIKPDTVRRYIRSGKLRAVKLVKVWRISETDLKTFLDTQTRSNQDE